MAKCKARSAKPKDKNNACDLLQHGYHVFLVGIYVYVVCKSFTRLMDRKVAAAESMSNAALQPYPSITMCPFFDIGDPTVTPTLHNFSEPALHTALVFKFTHRYRLNGKPKIVSIKGSDLQNETYKNIISVDKIDSSSGLGFERCITYNPPGYSPVGYVGQFVIELDTTEAIFWALSLHERGHFVPGTGKLFGSAFAASNVPRAADEPHINKFTVMEVMRTEAFHLNEDGAHCNETDADIDVSMCLSRHTENVVGCRMPWLKQEPDKLKKCTTAEQYENALKTTARLQVLDEKELYHETGCMPKCHRNQFDTSLVASKVHAPPPGEEGTSSVELIIFYSNSRYKVMKEYLTYTASDLLTSVGSYTSLFLGYNMRTIYGAINDLVKKCRPG